VSERRAVRSRKEDDLKMALRPLFFRKELLEVALCLNDIFSVA
jgi:hypothetical protein